MRSTDNSSFLEVAEFDGNCIVATLYILLITRTLQNVNALVIGATAEHKMTYMYQLSTKQILGHVLKYTVLGRKDKISVAAFHKIKATTLLNLNA